MLRLIECRSWVRAQRSQSLDEVFDFARDYLGLVKAAVIASRLDPPRPRRCNAATRLTCLRHLTGREGRGIEIVSKVNGIPKGSRLEVSTNLLASPHRGVHAGVGQTSLAHQDRWRRASGGWWRHERSSANGWVDPAVDGRIPAECGRGSS